MKKKEKEQDYSGEINKLKTYMAIMAIVIVVMGVYVVATSFGGLKLGATGKGWLITIPGNAIYVDSSRNVGIGTSAPTDDLDVNGGIKAGYISVGSSSIGSGMLQGGFVASNSPQGKTLLVGPSFIKMTGTGQYIEINAWKCAPRASDGVWQCTK